MNHEMLNPVLEQPINERAERLKELHELRFDYLDELPTEKIVPYETPNWDKYKCRTNFLTSVYLIIEDLQKNGLINGAEAMQAANEFIDFCRSRKRTTNLLERTDIDKTNLVLDAFIRELS